MSDTPINVFYVDETGVFESGNQETRLLFRGCSSLGFSVRTRKACIRLGIANVGDLVKKTTDELLECKNFGMTGLREIEEKLTKLGLKLKDR